MKSLMIVLTIFTLQLEAKLCSTQHMSEEDRHDIYFDTNEEFEFTTNIDVNDELENVPTSFSVQLVGFENWRGGEEVQLKVEKARGKLEKIISSKLFRTEIYNHTYAKKQQFKRNQGKSNQEIYKIILEGADKYNRTVDYELDMILCPYYSQKNVIGYTYSNRKEIWVNMRYYRDGHAGFDENSIVGNLLHEWLHNAGFGHSFEFNSTRKYTVPYAVGYLASGIAEKL